MRKLALLAESRLSQGSVEYRIPAFVSRSYQGDGAGVAFRLRSSDPAAMTAFLLEAIAPTFESIRGAPAGQQWVLEVTPRIRPDALRAHGTVRGDVRRRDSDRHLADVSASSLIRDMARRLAVPQAVCIALAAVVVLMPELLAAIDVHLLSSWYQPRLGRVASISAALALPVVYLGLTTREPAVHMRRSVRYAPVAAGAALVLCLVLPWILQRGLVMPTWIVDVVNALSVVAYVGFFTACAASLSARFVAARAEAVRAGVASGLPNESDADRARLEGIVLNALRYRPVEQWMQHLTASCLAVCRVERATGRRSAPASWWPRASC